VIKIKIIIYRYLHNIGNERKYNNIISAGNTPIGRARLKNQMAPSGNFQAVVTTHNNIVKWTFEDITFLIQLRCIRTIYRIVRWGCITINVSRHGNSSIRKLNVTVHASGRKCRRTFFLCRLYIIIHIWVPPTHNIVIVLINVIKIIS